MLIKTLIITALVAACAFVAVPASGQSSVPRERQVYVLGDSYTVQMQREGLVSAFGADWQVTAAGRGGRNVKVTPPTPSGMQQVRSDQARVAQVGHIVIALGTNRGDSSRFIDNMKLLLRDIRAFNPTAKLYWVEIGHFTDCWNKPPECFTSSSIQRQITQRNRDMNALAPSYGIKVVPWAQAAYANQQWFAADSSHKHPDAVGTRALINLIVSAVR